MFKLLITKKFLKTSGLTLLVAVGAATGIGAGIAAGVSSQSEKLETIALILSTRNNPYFAAVANGVNSVAVNNKKYKVQILDSQDDQQKEIENVNNAISQGVKGIIINVVNSETAWNSSLAAAYRNNIPIIAVDRGVNNATTGAVKQTIASDNVAASKSLAQWFLQNYNFTYNEGVFHLQGVAGAQAANDRSKGFLEGLGGPYAVEQRGDFNRATAQQVTQNTLPSQGNNFSVIFADNDQMALGAINAITTSNKNVSTKKPFERVIGNNYYVLGFDGDADALNAIKEDKMVATVAQQPKLMGEIAFNSMVSLLNGETIDEIKAADTVIVSKENVDEYL
ncbi:substrate-binding domain-containing protein [Mycoplasmopsis agassizii]|uniref:Periplasmic binding protein domain-containing protein n=1 Tax=Mycoplasmopsis agassizii TaxID=33922 RepID=A0ABX4H4K9_9BACT|nr:substrate-binding domain-containing protein [Mycoplasmopsis agassizii]PAF54831.1 hypothetical protein CJF60_03795 [Mycoplasmopsis agassizii]SMC18649.1 ribose transport system substrate-binding protein [Mycoplasmopsis agassizii]